MKCFCFFGDDNVLSNWVQIMLIRRKGLVQYFFKSKTLAYFYVACLADRFLAIKEMLFSWKVI